MNDKQSEQLIQFEAIAAPTIFSTTLEKIKGYTAETGTEEMKVDVEQLARAADQMKDVPPGTVWGPVRNMIESQLGGGVIYGLSVEEKYDVLKPIFDLIDKNREMLEESNIISGGATVFAGGIDEKLGEYMKTREDRNSS